MRQLPFLSLLTLLSALGRAIRGRSLRAAAIAFKQFGRDEPIFVAALAAFALQAITGVLPVDSPWVLLLTMLLRPLVYAPSTVGVARADAAHQATRDALAGHRDAVAATSPKPRRR